MAGYATLQDLKECGLPPGALSNIAPAIQQHALDRASAYADGFLRDRYTLPLQPIEGVYDPSLIDAICEMASYRLMKVRGYNPDSGADSLIRQGWLDATAWLQRVANGQVNLLVQQSDPASLQPVVATQCPRGYERLGHGVSGSGNWGI